jgi:small subunit ribosomal protein S5
LAKSKRRLAHREVNDVSRSDSRGEREVEEWVPRTRVGKFVKEGRITTIEDIFKSCDKIREPEIVDTLIQNLEEEVIDINLVQKQTDAGEKSKFKATVIVGNGSGLVGLGEGKAKEVGPAIKKAVKQAKLNIIPVRCGCGSWECNCGAAHSLPFKIGGKSGSVRITLVPAPKGVGLAIADVPKTVLRLAGIKDIWSYAKGHTRCTVNFAKATFNALKRTYYIVSPKDWSGGA